MEADDFRRTTLTKETELVETRAPVVAGAAAMDIVNNGVPAHIQIRYTNVHVKRTGAWQMVAWQATRIP